MLSILNFAIPIWNLSDGSVSWPQTLKVEGDSVLVERKDGRPWKTEPCDSLRDALSVYEDGVKVQLDNEMARVLRGSTTPRSASSTTGGLTLLSHSDPEVFRESRTY